MNFEDFSNKVKKISKDTVQEVQRLNEVRILKGQVNDAKKQINGLYSDMGKRLYEQYKEAPMDGFETEIHSITDKIAQIEELKERIRKVKGVVICPCCNMEVAAGEKFCSNCGNQMPDTEPDSEDEDEIIIDVEVEDGEVVDVTVEEDEDIEEAAADTQAEAPISDSEAAEEPVSESEAEPAPTSDTEAAEEPVSDSEAADAPVSETEQEATVSEHDAEATAEPASEETTEKEPEGE
jgi:hypothetical protein